MPRHPAEAEFYHAWRRACWRKLLEAGFTRADLETGAVRIEDALLLGEDEKTGIDEMKYAQERLTKHQVNEAARREAEIETDLERWMNGKPIND